MKNFFEDYKLNIADGQETAFNTKYDVYQDGTTPMYRDVDGKLWAISGHSHMGRIGMFCGTCIEDMRFLYHIDTNFCVGNAEYAFSGIKYPEGIKARGSIWPFGIYICPTTHRFFCFFHNESGWNGKGTAYDAYGLCKTPTMDSDFRHIGLMHSDDEGKTWTFDRWVLTAETVCFTQNFNPDNVNVVGQPTDVVSLGSGDFSIYVEPQGEYIYLFYNVITLDLIKKGWLECDVCVARTRKRADGVMGDFVKYYNGSFCEAGNFGKESVIVKRAWHPRISYLEKYGKYVMSSSRMQPTTNLREVIEDVMQIRTSDNLLDWSEPIAATKEGKPFGNHYVAMLADDDKTQPNLISGDTFSVLSNHNGTNVTRYKTVIEKK